MVKTLHDPTCTIDYHDSWGCGIDAGFLSSTAAGFQFIVLHRNTNSLQVSSAGGVQTPLPSAFVLPLELEFKNNPSGLSITAPSSNRPSVTRSYSYRQPSRKFSAHPEPLPQLKLEDLRHSFRKTGGWNRSRLVEALLMLRRCFTCSVALRRLGPQSLPSLIKKGS